MPRASERPLSRGAQVGSKESDPDIDRAGLAV